jgi:Tol biopolymer transport system component
MSPRASRTARLALLICALATAFAAPALAREQQPGRIAFDHIVVGGPTDIFTIDPDGRHARQITHTPPTQGGSELPAWSANADRLYFDSDRAGNIHAFSMNATGFRVRQITTGDGSEFTPRPSPDGKLLAFEHDAADLSSGIYLQDRHERDFGDARKLTFAPTGGFDTEPEFSPSGSKLAFLRVLSTVRPNAMSAVFVINVDGSGLTQLTPYDLNAIDPHWSPDGTRLLFSSNSDNFSDQLSANICVIDADGSDLTQITHDTDASHSFTPDWSPDGTQIVFAHAAPSGADLRIMRLDTGATRVIWHGADGTVDQDPAWGGDS